MKSLLIFVACLTLLVLTPCRIHAQLVDRFTDCVKSDTVTTITTSLDLSWTFEPSACPPVVSAPAIVGANKARYSLSFGNGWCRCYSAPLTYFQAGTPSGAAGDRCDAGAFATNATFDSPPDGEPSLNPTASSQASVGSGSIVTTNETKIVNRIHWCTGCNDFSGFTCDDPAPGQGRRPCESHGSDLILGLSLASAVQSVSWNIPSSQVIQFLPEIHYSIDFETVSGVNPCGGGGNLESTAPSVRRVDLVDIRITGTYSDNSVQTQTTQAVYAIFDNGTVARLGFFSHPLYDPAINGGNFEVNTGGTGFPISLSIPTTDLISLSFDPRIESFGALDGDLTPTYQSGDTLTCLDRQAMAGLVGVSIGDATYTPRADFDVDGVIDSDDYAAFCALHWAATPCRADFNCSGSVTVQDVFDHQGAYFNGSLEADFDCTGTLSVQDLFDFLDAYFTGCQ